MASGRRARRSEGVNLTGVFLASREAARIMRAGDVQGTIFMVSSVHEQIPWKTFSHYCASKGGMKLFAQSIARELAPHGIRVVSVAPTTSRRRSRGWRRSRRATSPARRCSSTVG